MSIEREAKLSAAPDVVLPDLHDVFPGITVGPSSLRRLKAVYFDTADLALARSGLTVRSRTGEPGPLWTVKLPEAGRGSVLSRREVAFEGPVGQIPLGALGLVLAYRRGHSLAPVATVRTTRTQFDLTDGTGRVATVCDDTVSARAGTAKAIMFREIEIELGEGNTDDDFLDTVVGRFRAAGCKFEKRTVAKVFRALGEAAIAAPDVVVADIVKKASIAEVVTATFARSVQQVIRFDSAVRLDLDPEDLHQFRVATRRLRSDLRTFGPLLDATWAKALTDELRWLDDAVGAERDADVMLSRLVERLSTLGPADAPAARRLRHRLDEQRIAGRARLSEAMSTDRYVTLLNLLVSAASVPGVASDPVGVVDEAARMHLAVLARKPWRQLRRGVDALSPESSADELHRVRTLAKRCRYCAEAAALVFGDNARRLGDRLADVQTVLGDHHDTVVAEAWFRDAARAMPSTGIVAGQLVAAEQRDRERHRQELRHVWKRAARPSLREWIK